MSLRNIIIKEFKWKKFVLMAFDTGNYYELIFLHLLFLRNWATTSNNRMWWCKYLKILSQNMQVTERYNLFLGMIHAWAFKRQQQGSFKKNWRKKCTLWFLSGAFVNFGKFWEQILSEGKVHVYLWSKIYPLIYQNVPCFSASFPMKFLGKSARRDVKKNKLCTQYYLLNIIFMVYTK